MTEHIIPFAEGETRMAKGCGHFRADAIGIEAKSDTIYLFNRSAKSGVTTIGHVVLPNDMKVLAELRNQLTELIEDKTMGKPVRIALETMQFFEMDLPSGKDPEEFADSQEAREIAADLILDGMIDFTLERIFDKDGNEL